MSIEAAPKNDEANTGDLEPTQASPELIEDVESAFRRDIEKIDKAKINPEVERKLMGTGGKSRKVEDTIGKIML